MIIVAENLLDYFDIFADEALTKKIECFDAGESQIGVTTKKTFYMKNTTKGFIELFDVWFEKGTASIVKKPEFFGPGEVHSLVVEVVPPLGIEEGMKDIIMFKGKQTFRP